MRRGVLLTAAAVLLAGPTVLAFHSGGYFDGPRFAATLVAWLLVLVAAVAAASPIPRLAPGRVALAGLALIAVWTAVSLTWAPLSESATDALVRLLLYTGALIAAAALLRERLALRAVEPVLAAGALVVIAYGLLGRLLSGVIHMNQSRTALGRLEQPITYWNAEGTLAAIGLVLCARLAGSPARPPALRIAAAGACAPLGMGLYLTYSRGALAACLAGLVVLVAIAPTRPQLRAGAIALGVGLMAAVASELLAGVSSIQGPSSDRERDGAIALAVLVVLTAAAALVQARATRLERGSATETARLGIAPRLPAVGAIAVLVAIVGLVAASVADHGNTKPLTERTGLSRLGSADSLRYDYWKVGLEGFADNPLTGVGAGGFRAEWVRERPVDDPALEVHSLPLEMLTELGLPGLAAFGMFVGGVAVAGRRALRAHPELAAGACAGAVVWGLHATIDWDWQLPAVTLPALVLAGALIALSEAADAGSAEAVPSATRAGSAA